MHIHSTLCLVEEGHEATAIEVGITLDPLINQRPRVSLCVRMYFGFGFTLALFQISKRRGEGVNEDSETSGTFKCISE